MTREPFLPIIGGNHSANKKKNYNDAIIYNFVKYRISIFKVNQGLSYPFYLTISDSKNFIFVF